MGHLPTQALFLHVRRSSTVAREYFYGWPAITAISRMTSVTKHESCPQAPMRPARDHRAMEKVMKAVLIVAAIAGALLLLYMAPFFSALFAVAR